MVYFIHLHTSVSQKIDEMAICVVAVLAQCCQYVYGIILGSGPLAIVLALVSTPRFATWFTKFTNFGER